VVTALGRAVQALGHDVEVVIPKYDCADYRAHAEGGLRHRGQFSCHGLPVHVWETRVAGLRVTLLEPECWAFRCGCVYGRGDDKERFELFCAAAAQHVRQRAKGPPDVLHCHDWTAAAVCWAERASAAAVLTVHNIAFGQQQIGEAMAHCDVATTVSPSYAQEVAGHPAVASHVGKLHGVRNGIDAGLWDPGVRPAKLPGLKAQRRAELARRFGLDLPPSAPLVVSVSRLTQQKGLGLIRHGMRTVLESGGAFVLLGTAPEDHVNADFAAMGEQLSAAFPGRVHLELSFDEPLSRLLYAAADVLLMPSACEPCGLSQLVAMRFGAVPVVRRTGGLADTVFDVRTGAEAARRAGVAPNGFAFDGEDAAALDGALGAALGMFRGEPDRWRELCVACASQDWSWGAPAAEYVDVYWLARRQRNLAAAPQQRAAAQR